MRIHGRRILVAGSAGESCSPDRLAYAHELVRELVEHLTSEGATFVVLVGREPRLPPAQGGYAQIFDWMVLSVLHEKVVQGTLSCSSSTKPIATVVTARTEAQIPSDRRPIWEDLIKRECVAIIPGEWSWTSGAIRRSLLASHADILITLGGGEGVEHYGSLFQARSKPVIPLDLEVGSSSTDGSGGSLRLLERVRSDPSRFFPHTAPEIINSLLQSLITRNGQSAPVEVAEGLVRLLETISPPTAFYVRLLNAELPDFNDVEHFFRKVVDPFVKDLDYTPVQMGRTPTSKPFLNTEIFTRIQESTLVIADITAIRPNCLLELGYALALGRQVIVTATRDTAAPFDVQSVDRFEWDPRSPDGLTLERLHEHWDRVRTRPALVEAHGGL